MKTTLLLVSIPTWYSALLIPVGLVVLFLTIWAFSSGVKPISDFSRNAPINPDPYGDNKKFKSKNWWW